MGKMFRRGASHMLDRYDIVGQNTGVVSRLNFDSAGKLESVTETQSGAQTGATKGLAQQAAERHRPVYGNTQDHMRHIAEVPPIFVNELMRRGIWGDQKRVKQWLREDCPRDFIVGPVGYLR